MSEQINLGDIVRDRITGFSGVAIGKHKWLTGCDTITVKPRELKDGKPIDSLSFDVMQLEVVERGVLNFDAKPVDPSHGDGPATYREPARKGGPREEPRRGDR